MDAIQIAVTFWIGWGIGAGTVLYLVRKKR